MAISKGKALLGAVRKRAEAEETAAVRQVQPASQAAQSRAPFEAKVTKPSQMATVQPTVRTPQATKATKAQTPALQVTQRIAQAADQMKGRLNPGAKTKTAYGLLALPGVQEEVDRVKGMLNPGAAKQAAWTPGQTPPLRDVMARFAQMAETDREGANALFAEFEPFLYEPGSPYCTPYSTASNRKALDNLSGLLGEDLTGGVDDEWLERNKFLLGGARYTTTGETPAAPTKSSTAAQDAAYWYYQLVKDSETTNQAEAEWTALQREIADLVNDPRSYDDDEVLARLDLSKYKTLAKMDEGKAAGTPLALNRAVGYSEDALYGAIFAARNGGGTGDSLADAVNYALGRGQGYVPDVKARSARDPNSPNYNPNAHSTVYDLERKYGVEGFDQAWVDGNRWMMESLDGQEQKDYARIRTAVGNFGEAERELSQAKTLVSDLVATGLSDDEIRAELTRQELPMLGKLLEGKETGAALEMAGGVTFDVDRMIKDARGGKPYVPDPASEAARTPGTDAYHPYLQATYRTNPDWNPEDTSWQADLVISPETGKPVKPGKDATQAQLDAWDRYKAQGAMETTAQALMELEALNTKIAEWIASGDSAETIIKRIGRQLAATGESAKYTTLQKMETYRREGGYLPLTEAVDFTMPQTEAQVRQMVAERDGAAGAEATEQALPASQPLQGDADTAQQAEQGFSVLSFEQSLHTLAQEEGTEAAKGVELNLLYGIADYLSTGATDNEDAQAWVERYGWALDDTYINHNPGGLLSIKSVERSRDRLGDVAGAAVRQARSEHVGVLDKARLAMQVTRDMETAEQQGLSLDAYYQANPDQAEALVWVDQAVAEGVARDEEVKEEMIQAGWTQLTEALSWDASGRPALEGGDQRGAIYASVLEQYSATSVTVFDRTQSQAAQALSDETGRLLGEAGQAEARGASLYVTEMLDGDIRFAKMLGLSLDELYERYPDMQPDAEEAARSAIERFEAEWGGQDNFYWLVQGVEGALQLDGLSERAQMYQETGDASAVAAAFSQDAAASGVPEGEGIGGAYARGRGIAAGGTSWWAGQVNAFDVFLLRQETENVIKNVRNQYTAQYGQAGRQQYYEDVEASLAGKSEEEQAYWRGRMEQVGDIYALGYNIASEDTQTYLEKIETNLAAIQQDVMTNGTEEERNAFNRWMGITENAIMMTESFALSMAGVPGFAATTMAYGAPAGAQMGRDLMDSGMDVDAAKAAGAGAALITGVLESAVQVNLPRPGASSSSRIFGWLRGNGASRTVANGSGGLRAILMTGVKWAGRQAIEAPFSIVEEGFQEGVESLVMGTYEDLVRGNGFQGLDIQGAWKEAKAAAPTAVFLQCLGSAYNSAAYKVARSIEQRNANPGTADGITQADVQSMEAALDADAQNPAVVSANLDVATNAATADILLQQGAAGTMNDALNGPEAQAVDTARSTLDEASAKVQALTSERQDADTAANRLLRQFIENKADKAASDAYIRARDDAAQVKETLAKAIAEQSTAQQAFNDASAAYNSVRQTAYGQVRAEAQAQVSEQMNTDMAQIGMGLAQAETETVAQPQTAPEGLDADAAVAEIMQTRFADADPAQRTEIEAALREGIARELGEAEAVLAGVVTATRGSAASPAGAEAVNRFAAKYGINIEYDGSIRGRGEYNRARGTVTLNPAASIGEAMMDVALHEATHHIEVAEGYDAYAGAALQYKYQGDMQALGRDIQAKQDAYARQGVTLDEAGARQEIVAGLTPELYTDPKAVAALVQDAPGIAQRILDGIKRVAADIKAMLGIGAEGDATYRQLKQAQDLFQAALVERAQMEQGQGADAQYSLAMLPDGTPYVIVDTDQARFEGLDGEALRREARKAIIEHFSGKVVGSEGNRAFVNGVFASKYTHGYARHSNPQAHEAKMLASTEIDNLVTASRYLRHEDSRKGEDDAPGGYDYYETLFDIGAPTLYSSVITVRNTQRGRQLKDISHTKESPAKNDQVDKMPTAIGTSDSIDSIQDENADVNSIARDVNPDTQYSLEDDVNAAIREYMESRGLKPRGFNAETAQRGARLTDEQKLAAVSTERAGYVPETLDEWMTDGRQRVREMGYDEAKKAFYELNDPTSAQDVAFANAVIEEAQLRGDSAYLDILLQYGEQGTSLGKGLAARKIFSRTTPAGAGIFAVTTAEKQRSEILDKMNQAGRDGLQKGIDRNLGDVTGKLGVDADASVTDGPAHNDSRWKARLTAGQEAMIDQYNLGDAKLPGLHYNRATTKQRMLSAILDASGVSYRTLVTQLEQMRKNLPVTTLADVHYIEGQMRQYHEAGGEQGDKAAEMALGRANEAMGNIQPRTARQKRESYRKSAMLLNGRTIGRNVLSNVINMPMEGTSRVLGAGIDAVMAKITGERTATLNTMQEYAAQWKGFTDEVGRTMTDYWVDKVDTSQAGRYDQVGRRVYQNSVGEFANQLTGFLMQIGDRPFWRRSYLRSIAEQQRIGSTTEITQAMHEQAVEDANYTTFSEDNRVVNALQQLKNIPGIGTVVDYVIPFAKIPTNLVKRMYEYSPVGLVGTALKQGLYEGLRSNGNFDQRRFVQGMARGLTGTGVTMLGYMLAASGLLQFGYEDEDDTDLAQIRRAQGEPYTLYLNVGDHNIDVSWISPFVFPLTMGARLQKALKNDESLFDAAYSGLISAGDMLFDQSFMASVQNVMNGGTEGILLEIPKSMISQNIPSMVRQIASAIDPYVRDTTDQSKIHAALNSALINSIPGLRQTLPAKVDVTGQPFLNEGGFVSNMLLPFALRTDRYDEALQALIDLAEKTGRVDFLPGDTLYGAKNDIAGGLRGLTDEEKERFRREYGTLLFEGGTTTDKTGAPVQVIGLRALMESDTYQNADPNRQADMVKAMDDAALLGTREEWLEVIGRAEKPEAAEYNPKEMGGVPSYFAEQPDSYVMRMLNGLYEETGDARYLPSSINTTFSVKDDDGESVKYTVPKDMIPVLYGYYAEELEVLLDTVDLEDEDMTEEERAEAAASVVTRAKNRAQKAYWLDYGE